MAIEGMEHEKKQIGDMKVGAAGSRPKLSILGRNAMIYAARGHEYGASKYARGNYYGPPPVKDGKSIDVAERFMGYIDAAQRHLAHIAQAYNIAMGSGGDTHAAIACVDDEASGGFPASMLPHMAHALASLFIGTEVAVMDGLLPADPGQPWVALLKGAMEALAQKDNPAAERARVEALRVASETKTNVNAGPVVPRPISTDEIRASQQIDPEDTKAFPRRPELPQ